MSESLAYQAANPMELTWHSQPLIKVCFCFAMLTPFNPSGRQDTHATLGHDILHLVGFCRDIAILNGEYEACLWMVHSHPT